MKTTLLLFVAISTLLFFPSVAQSQKVKPGLTAGVSLNNMNLNIKDVPTELGDVNGFEGGLYATFSALNWYVRPMVVASYLRGNVTTTVDGVKMKESKFKLTTLETPLFVGLKLLPGFSIEAGPSWNYLMSYTDNVNDINIDLTRHHLGYRAGLRLSFARLGAFGHYGGLLNTSASDDTELKRPDRIIFGITLDLVSGK